MKPRIFVFVNGRGGPSQWGASDVIGCAIAEDGTVLAHHLSSHEQFYQHDMGLTSDWKHDKYQAHYPDGYELVEADPPEEVLARNRAGANG